MVKRFTIENGILKGEERIFNIGSANLGEKILQILKSNPNIIGQVDAITGEECTYQKMTDESIRCSLWLRKEGMNSGDTVCLFTHNHLTTYVPCLATFFNRGILCPAFSGYSIENIKYIIDIIKPKFMFVDEREAILFQKIVEEKNLNIKIITFNKIPGFISLKDIFCLQKMDEISNFICTKSENSEDKCLLVFTSGSSGEPKPTLHTYKSIMETVMISLEKKNKDSNVTINYSPMGWICGIINMIIDLVSCVKKIIVHEKGHEPEEVFGFIEKYKVNKLFLGLGMIYHIYVSDKLENYDLSSIKSLSLGGTKIKPEIMKFIKQILPNCSLQLTYGSTELQMLSFISKSNTENLDSCGFIFPNVNLKVINPQNGENLGPNKKGELCFKSPYMMKEYYNNPEATKKSIDEDGWYHSGDIGYFDDNGNGYIVGRKSKLSISKEIDSINWEIERILLLNNEIIETSTITILDNSISPRIFAYVTLIPGSKLKEKELSAILECLTIKEHKVTVKILKSMPLTYNGKVKLDVLRKMSEKYLLT